MNRIVLRKIDLLSCVFVNNRNFIQFVVQQKSLHAISRTPPWLFVVVDVVGQRTGAGFCAGNADPPYVVAVSAEHRLGFVVVVGPATASRPSGPRYPAREAHPS